MKIVTLIENESDSNDLLINEHGLSLYIEVNNKKILFDTGKTGSFIDNASKLNIDLNNLDYVILSHGHYDHSGGFKELVSTVPRNFTLIIGKDFFNLKYKLSDDTYKFNGNSFDKEFIAQNEINTNFIDENIYKISDNIFIFSNFDRVTDFEHLNNNFYIMKNDSYVKDTFTDEISLAIKTDKGLVVIVGCSHRGIVNILKTIQTRANLPIYAVIGGSHLIEGDELRINKTLDFFRDNNISLLKLCHCTGERALNVLKTEFKTEFSYTNTGNEIEIL